MAALSINNAIGAGAGGGGSALSGVSPATARLSRRSSQLLSPSLSLFLRTSHIAAAASNNRSSSRAGRVDGRNRRGSAATTTEDPFQRKDKEAQILGPEAETGEFADDGFVMPALPGQEPNFWEGTKWDGLGFFVQYLWAFGVVFALIACGIAVVTYNEGATDFKETPAYKESVQTQELLEEPDASNSDVFESNPTEAAPRLD
ncbi:hypothetical protein Dimus_027060 [Dionaea muscipula]